MLNQQLFDYIKQQLAQGTTKEIINTNLLSQGWQQQDVIEAFSAIENQDVSIQPNVLSNDANKNTERFTTQNVYFGKIETKEGAIKVIKNSSNGFLILGAIQILAGFLNGAGAFIDGAIFLILALLLRKFNSRVVAVMLLVLSLGMFFFTGMNALEGGQGGQNVLLALAAIWIGVRAIQATFVYNKVK